LKRLIQIFTWSKFSSIFPLNFYLELVIGWHKNLNLNPKLSDWKIKVLDNSYIYYLDKPFQKLATFNELRILNHPMTLLESTKYVKNLKNSVKLSSSKYKIFTGRDSVRGGGASAPQNFGILEKRSGRSTRETRTLLILAPLEWKL